MSATCPWCSAPRQEGPECPRCGANYAKAEMIRAQGKAAAVPPPAPAVEAPAVAVAVPLDGALEGGAQDRDLELKFCIGAIPIALALAVLFHLFMPFLQRTFLAMPVHELGHALAAWFTGHWAIPTLWKTLNGEERGFITPLLLLGALGYLIFVAQRAERYALVALGALLVALQAIGTLLIKPKTAAMLIVFGGDGIGMVLATALMASFFFGKDTQLYKGSLRWGCLVIGAAAFVDLFAVWWAARRDAAAIPFGEMEGVGLSDATKLVDDFGWTADQMVRRYVTLGIFCLLALAAVYAWGVWRAWRDARPAD